MKVDGQRPVKTRRWMPKPRCVQGGLMIEGRNRGRCSAYVLGLR
jgi:hypothetical protein